MPTDDAASAEELGPVRQLLLQATSFCNIACGYCYLDAGARATRDRMAIETVERAFQRAAGSGACHDPIECRWHAGEPLTRGVDFYRAAFERAVRAFGAPPKFWFSVQTNGVLIDGEWCRFFRDCGVEVGVSLDGPEHLHDRQRVDRGGRGTFQRVMRGVERLRRHGIPFDAICVLDDDALAEPDAIHAFFAAAGCRSVGFNTDDLRPGRDDPAAVAARLAAYRRFMARLLELTRRGGPPRVREIDDMRRAVLAATHPIRSATAEPLAIVSIDAQGNLSTFSPELLTISGVPGAPGGRPFVLGNVWQDTWPEVVRSARFLALAEEVRAGVRMCRAQCAYFPLCGGGSPANKLYENQSLVSTETFFCRSRIKAVADLVLADFEASIDNPRDTGDVR